MDNKEYEQVGWFNRETGEFRTEIASWMPACGVLSAHGPLWQEVYRKVRPIHWTPEMGVTAEVIIRRLRDNP